MWWQRIAVLALLPYALWLIYAYEYHFLDGVNLALHEGGHLVFAFFGQTLHVLGGTLVQLFFPAACLFHFAQRGERFEASLMALWLAESAMYTARYLGDARAQQLPLVGGHIHDFHWLLSHVGLLEWCEQISRVLHGGASLLALGALSFAAREAIGLGQRQRSRTTA